jgi:hypothetical protein
MANNKQVLKALRQADRTPGHIDADTFAAQGSLSTTASGARSELATLKTDTVQMLRDDIPFLLALPAYEQFSTVGDGSTQTFNLANDIVDSPYVEALSLWSDGARVAADSIDFAGDAFDYSDGGAVEELDAFYICGDAATLEIRKEAPASNANSSQQLYRNNIGRIHRTDLAEQPEYLQVDKTDLQPFIASDWDLTAYLNAPYTVRWDDDADRGAEPDNALLDLPAYRGQATVAGLGGVIQQDIAGDR